MRCPSRSELELDSCVAWAIYIPSGHEEIGTEIQRKQKRLYFLENQKNKSGIFSFLNSVSVVIRVTFLSLVGAMTYSLLTEEPPKNASFMSTLTVT